MSSSPKNITVAVLAVALAGVGTLAWWQSREIAELKLTAARAEEGSREAQKRVVEVEVRVAAVEKHRAELEAQRNEPRARPVAERVRANTANGAPRNAATPLENPAVQRMLATGMRGSLDQRYGTLFRQLKLSPTELEKLKDLLTERQMSSLDAMTAARAQGANPTELPAIMEKVQADVDNDIHELLGESRFDRYQSFNQNAASYTALDQIERRLSYTNAPLSATQSEALLQVLIETAPAAGPENAPMRNMLGVVQSFAGTSPMVASLGGGGPSISSQTIERASGVLNPAQLEALRQLQVEQQSQASMMQSVRVNAFTGATVSGSVEMIRAAPGSVAPAQPPASSSATPQR